MQARGVFDTSREVSIGVDWLTATKKRAADESVFNALGRRLVVGRNRAGFESSGYSWNGYRGLKAEGVAWGRRNDTSIIRLSGDFASYYWREVAQICDNITRIDCQVTYHVENHPSDYITESYERCLEAQVGRGRPFVEKYFGNRFGMTGFQLGSRFSDNYARMYDKGVESREERWQNCVRAETVIQGKRALPFCRQLMGKLYQAEAIDACTQGMFKRRGCVLRSAEVPLRSTIAPVEDAERGGTRKFIVERSRSYVSKLIDAGNGQHALEFVNGLIKLLVDANINTDLLESTIRGKR